MGRTGPDGRYVSTSSVRFDVTDGVAVLTLVNPPANAIDTNLVEQIGAALDLVTSRPDIRVLILTADGPELFSAGSDLLEIATMLGPGVAVARKLGLQFDVFGRLAALPVPTIAALNGHALGGGLEVVVCCDLVVAEEQVRLGSPEIRVGLFPSSGGTFRVSRRVGPTRAKELQLLGEPISAGRALGWGLVTRVVPTGTALIAAREMAATLLDRPAGALAAVKRLVDASVELSDRELIAMSLQSSERAFTSRDGAEGVAAFLEKRPARFSDTAAAGSTKVGIQYDA